jgi:hypothetical protein
MIDVPVKVGPVELRLPPEAELARMLRLAGSGLASLDGFTVNEIEDIMVAVSEVFLALIEHGRGDPVAISMWVADHAFNVRGSTPVDQLDLHHPDLVLARTVLSLVADEHHLDLLDHQAEIWASVKESTGNSTPRATNGTAPDRDIG